MEKISTLDILRQKASEDDGVDCFIALNGGFKSSKKIWYEDEDWSIFHEIDDTFELLGSDEELKEKTNIIEAIEKEALYEY